MWLLFVPLGERVLKSKRASRSVASTGFFGALFRAFFPCFFDMVLEAFFDAKKCSKGSQKAPKMEPKMFQDRFPNRKSIFWKIQLWLERGSKFAPPEGQQIDQNSIKNRIEK